MSVDFDPLHKWLGIPPSEQPPHCYRLLGLEAFEDNLDVIENAADRQMAFLRGFQSGPHAALAQEVIDQIQVARSWLLQPDRKAQYDAWLRDQLRAAAPPVPAAGESPPPTEWPPPSATVPPPSVSPAPPPPPVSVSPPAHEAAPDLEEILGGLDSYAPPVRKSPRGLRQQKIGLAISLSAAVLAVAALSFVVLKVHQSWSPDGTLEVDWPAEEREGGTLHVEGKPVSVPLAGKIVVSVPGGPRRVSILRPGYKAYELTVSVTPRQTTVVRPVWRALGEDDAQGEPAASTKTERDSPKDSSPIQQPVAEPKDDEKNPFPARDKREAGSEKGPVDPKP